MSTVQAKMITKLTTVKLGLDGHKIESKVKLDHNKGMFAQMLKLDWTFEEYV
jgi:hypothetical protein